MPAVRWIAEKQVRDHSKGHPSRKPLRIVRHDG
jgi:hypothetical protein